MPPDFVFVGPSLPRAQVEAFLPEASILPPVKQGDLLQIGAVAGDRVLIIDGLFMQAAPVRHKEILTLLASGVTVAGSSSMGALRAAELWQFGMRGVGEVFQLYRDLVIDGDDEVAVIHSTGESGYRALSEPLVSLRVAIKEACHAGTITPADAEALLVIAKAMPFRLRSLRMLAVEAAKALPIDVIDRFASWCRDHARDLKGSDAELMLRLAADQAPELKPHGSDDRPIVNARTTHLAAWEAQFRGTEHDGMWVSDGDVDTAIMLLVSNYPLLHRRNVLASLTGLTTDAPDLERVAIAQAVEHGLNTEALASVGAWLSPRERAGVRSPEFCDEAILRVLVRAFGTVSENSKTLRCVGRVADDRLRHQAHRAAASALRCNAMLPRAAKPGRLDRLHYRDEVVDRAYAQLWGCEVDDLIEAAWDRGFDSLATFRRLAEPFVAHLKFTRVEFLQLT